MIQSFTDRARGALLPAGLLVSGTVAFLGAGRFHPRIGSHMGPVGSDQFFASFLHEILSVSNWRAIHVGILAGPVLWAIGAAAGAHLVTRRDKAFVNVGVAALVIAATIWTLAFVFD